MSVTPIGTTLENIRILDDGFGTTTLVETVIGNFAAFSDGTVRFNSPHNEETALSDEQCTLIIKGVLSARYAADRWNERLRGHRVVRAERRDGQVFVTWCGRTESMRISKLRRPQTCEVCKEKVLALFVSVATHKEGEGRLYHARVCEPCVDHLAKAPTGLRAVDAPETSAP